MPKPTAKATAFAAGAASVMAEDVDRTIAWGRKETDPCQKGTDGCSIDHTNDHGSCETW